MSESYNSLFSSLHALGTLVHEAVGVMQGTVLCPCLLQVLELAENIKKQLPENIDYDVTYRILSIDLCPLNIVLLQEVISPCCCLAAKERYFAIL